MSTIKFYIANAAGDFNKSFVSKIESTYAEAEKVVVEKLKANKIDIIFINAPAFVIAEIGLTGNSPGPNNIYISMDPKNNKWTRNDMIKAIAHETHHCMRWRNPGYGKTLGEEVISEGLATLFEEEVGGSAPIYAKVKITESEIAQAKKIVNRKLDYAEHDQWFYGSGKVQRWFGYTWGYRLSKAYSEKVGRSAAELVNVDASLVLPLG